MLVELAVVAIVFSVLLGAMLALWVLFLSANVLQQAADVLAMELPLPPTARFPELGSAGRSSIEPMAVVDAGSAYDFVDADFQQEILDGTFLVVDLVTDLGAGEAPDDSSDDKPLINRLLHSVTIFDEANIKNALGQVVRCPGSPARNSNTGDLTVLIPRVTVRDLTTGPTMTSQAGFAEV